MPKFQDFLNSQKRISGVRVNLVANSAGEFVDSNGSSRGISTTEDKALLVKLRSLADVIVTDAATARREQYKPSKYAPLKIWSSSGSFDGLTVQPGLEHIKVDDAQQELEHLKRNFESILLECGPTLTGLLAKVEAIDHANISVTGKLSSAEAREVYQQVAIVLHLEYLSRVELKQFENTAFFSASR